MIGPSGLLFIISSSLPFICNPNFCFEKKKKQKKNKKKTKFEYEKSLH
jgi:hypothetical protein